MHERALRLGAGDELLGKGEPDAAGLELLHQGDRALSPVSAAI
jgi:hypothetical protein